MKIPIRLFNTLGRKKQKFKPIKPGFVGIYCCGPTVYNYAHIGNLRTYIFEDILKRVLIFNGFKVKHVMNITDVGHLTSNADTGEDKIEMSARKQGKSPEEISEFYTKAFFEDLAKLNILNPDVVCKATEHIKDMIELIKKIEKHGYTYEAGGNVYFNTAKFKDYGKLSGKSFEQLQKFTKSRIEKDKNKKNPTDFVLWFTERGSKFKGHLQKWPSPWGVGWPGWHIECSAMSMKYLGKHFDIHCGGIDHIPVHHTNEIAQVECVTGRKWVNFWIHGQFLVLDKGRMGKSEGNFITLNELEKKCDSLAFRYLCLTAHYRKQLKFSWQSLENAQKSFEKLKKIIKIIKKEKTSFGHNMMDMYREKFLRYINDDLDIPEALALLWKILNSKQFGSKEKYELAIEFDNIFGLKLESLGEEKLIVPDEIKKLAEKRLEFRKNKEWGKADELRKKIKDKGYEIEDTTEGYILRK